VLEVENTKRKEEGRRCFRRRRKHRKITGDISEENENR
jgi:hypothetical protein